jgi:hypothetical protein
MRQVYRVTSDGFFVEDVILSDKQAVPSDCVDVAPVNQVDYTHFPKWTGTCGENSQGSWSEGGGFYRKEADGLVIPSKRFDPITREDGSRVRRDVAGKVFEREKNGAEREVPKPAG